MVATVVALTAGFLLAKGWLFTAHDGAGGERVMLKRKDAVGLVAAICCCFITAQEAGKLPSVKIIATGGTIAARLPPAQAEYKSGQVGVDALIKAVPTPSKVAG